MMFCRNCGKQLADDTKFCPSCGAPQNNGVNFRYSEKPQINNKSNSSNKGFKRVGITLTISGFAAWMLLLLILRLVIDRKPYRMFNYTSDEEEFILMFISLAFLTMLAGIGLIIAYIVKSRKK